LKFETPCGERGDKDVKKEVIKTSYPPLDFLEKKFSIIIFLLNATGGRNLIKIE
jgi:hypothetical protein